MKGDNVSATAKEQTSPSTNRSSLPKAPNIQAGTTFEDIKGFYKANEKHAKVIKVNPFEISPEEVRYEVTGQLFFVSKVYFLQGFDMHDHPSQITIDMSKAHIWDQSGVAALDQVIRKLSIGGSSVQVIGLNKESLDLFERMSGQESSHA